ncbi:hypothetical protein Tco_0709226, partial [Tanacetum coccineum]
VRLSSPAVQQLWTLYPGKQTANLFPNRKLIVQKKWASRNDFDRKHKVKRSIKVPVVSNTLADIPRNEYSWRKYGHEPIKGSHPSSEEGEYDYGPWRWAISFVYMIMEFGMVCLEWIIHKKRISTRKDGVVRILPPVSTAEIHAVEKERKARTILLMAIPKEHLRRFQDDAKEIWEAIRTRFGGKAQIQEDAIKRGFEQNSLVPQKSSASAQNVAFVSHSKSNNNKVKSGHTGPYSTYTPSTSSNNIPEREVPAGFDDEVIYSLFAKQSEDLDLLIEDLEYD